MPKIIDNIWSNTKSNTSNNDKYTWGSIDLAWQEMDNQQHIHSTGITSSGPWGAGKYEGLPNFVGGLFVEDGVLKILQENNNVVELGKVSDIDFNKKMLDSILDKFFE